MTRLTCSCLFVPDDEWNIPIFPSSFLAASEQCLNIVKMALHSGKGSHTLLPIGDDLGSKDYASYCHQYMKLLKIVLYPEFTIP